MSTGPQESSMDHLRLQRRGEHVSYQIFPEPSEQQEPVQVRSGAARLKERLPSIVVEPSEESEEDSREAQWFPRSQTSIEEQEEDEEPFQDQCEASSGGQDEQMRDVDGVPHCKRSSIPGIQIDYSRLTPPPSPTSSHAAPPCFHS